MTTRYRLILSGLGLVALSLGAACGADGGPRPGGNEVTPAGDEGSLSDGAGTPGGQSIEGTRGKPPCKDGGKCDPQEPQAEYYASIGFGGGNTFNACGVRFGDPNSPGAYHEAELTCNYPGSETCTVTEEGGFRCIDCTYPDGSGRSICLGDPNDPLPDPLAGRPDNLPPPGECATADGDAGSWFLTCTTCTNADGSAIKTCDFNANWCSYLPSNLDGKDSRESCVVCTAIEPSTAIIFCDPVNYYPNTF